MEENDESFEGLRAYEPASSWRVGGGPPDSEEDVVQRGGFWGRGL
jgi:hypothetical protein